MRWCARARASLKRWTLDVGRSLLGPCVSRNHSTNFGNPTASGVVGLYPRSFLAGAIRDSGRWLSATRRLKRPTSNSQRPTSNVELRKEERTEVDMRWWASARFIAAL